MDISEFPKNWMVIRLIEQKNVQNNEHKGSLLGSKNELSPIYDQNVGQVQDFRSTIRESMGVPKEQTTIRQTISRQDSGFHNPENYICKEHGKKMEFVCLNHQCRVCANCALVGIHKNHDIRSEEEVLKEIARKADKLVEVFEGIETTQTVMPQDLFNELFQRKLKEKSRELEDRVHRRFEECIMLMKAREKRVIEEINSKFSLLQIQLQTLNEFPFDLKTKLNMWREGAQVLLCTISDKADRGEIIYEMLDDKSSYKPDLISEGEKLVHELKRHSESPIDKLDRELNKLTLSFSNNFNSNVESLCVFVVPEMDLATRPRINTPETDVEPALDLKRMDSVNNRIRMSMENKNDNNLLEFEWNELNPNDLLRNSVGLRGTFGRKNPPQTQQPQEIISPVKSGKPLSNIPETIEHHRNPGSFGSPSSDHNKKNESRSDMEVSFQRDSNSTVSSLRTNMRTTHRKTGNTRSISPVGSVSRSDTSMVHKSGKSKKRALKVPQKYESIIEGIEGNFIEVADLFDADLGDSGVALLGEFIKENTCLKTLKLVKNKISDEGGIALVNALYENHGVENLHLQQNLLTERTIEAFLELFRTKRNLKTIFFNRNSINLSKVKNKVREIQELGINISI